MRDFFRHALFCAVSAPWQGSLGPVSVAAYVELLRPQTGKEYDKNCLFDQSITCNAVRPYTEVHGCEV